MNDKKRDLELLRTKMLLLKKKHILTNKINNLNEKNNISKSTILIKQKSEIITKNNYVLNKINNLNDYFDNIYVLNLDKDTQRMKRMSNILNELNIKYERFPGIYGKDRIEEHSKIKNLNNSIWENQHMSKVKNKISKNIGAFGCLLSHRAIIQDAINKKYKKILILEDDIMIYENFNKRLNEILPIISERWKLLYLGASQHYWININYRKNYYFANGTDSTFAYGIHSSIFNEILKVTKNFKFPIDYYYRYFQNKYFCPVIYPNLFISKVDESNTQGKRDIRKIAKQFGWKLSLYRLN